MTVEGQESVDRRISWLVGMSLCFAQGGYIDKLAAIATFGEENCAVDEGIDSVVFADAYVKAGVMHGAALTFDDVAGFALLTAEDFNAESLAF